ncbi:MAG: hypothetical protein IKN37_08690 [Bacteroidales bacterium]|nr:hypothetical protein [Bacteroidales bacterium]
MRKDEKNELEKIYRSGPDPGCADFCADVCFDGRGGGGFSEIEWLRVLSVSGVAFVLRILPSLATGLPEADH